MYIVLNEWTWSKYMYATPPPTKKIAPPGAMQNIYKQKSQESFHMIHNKQNHKNLQTQRVTSGPLCM